jgi:glycosyltransferase involved in cell wall biosynthesis
MMRLNNRVKKEIDILHIYAGTSGVAGLYIHEIYEKLKELCSQELVVSHYYPFPVGHKWFYRWSDLASPFARRFGRSRLRYLVRYFELFIALLRILFYASVHHIRAINYGLTSDLKIEYLFLRIIKKWSRSILLVTCHDVVPFFTSNNLDQQKRQLERKQKFFSLADFLIVHNESSEDKLKSYFGINDNKAIYVPFPVMDLNDLPCVGNEELLINKPPGLRFRVGIIGQLRKEKGLDILIEAWRCFYSPNKQAELIIAGNIPVGTRYNFGQLRDKSTLIIDHYIRDGLLKQLIRQCDVIVLPYTKGTNSGIPSSVISLGTLLIASDIPLFRANPLISEDFMFEANSPVDLCRLLNWVYGMTKEEKEHYIDLNRNRFVSYRNSFSKYFVEGSPVNKICLSREIPEKEAGDKCGA